MDPIKTRFLILSDTHGKDVPLARTIREIDVVIHCGDLTEGSTLEEYKASLKLLTAIRAPLKIVVPGKQDFTLDTLSYMRKAVARTLPVDPARVREVYGGYGEAKRMLRSKEAEGIFVLQDEGVYEFPLTNRALLTVFASPYTSRQTPHDAPFESPARNQQQQRQWQRQHRLAIPRPIDVAVTHGPPRGVLDASESDAGPTPTGCPRLFDAMARARPKLHCFGRVREQWGAEIVAWNSNNNNNSNSNGDEQWDERLPVRVVAMPSQKQLTRASAVDPERSAVVKMLADMRISVADLKSEDQGKVRERKECERRGYVSASLASGGGDGGAGAGTGGSGGERDRTLFVNAAIEGRTTAGRDMPRHLPWVVEIDLPRKMPGQGAGELGRRVREAERGGLEWMVDVLR